MSGATVLVDAPAGYEPERRYVLDEVLGDRLGLGWELRTSERSDVRIAASGVCAISTGLPHLSPFTRATAKPLSSKKRRACSSPTGM